MSKVRVTVVELDVPDSELIGALREVVSTIFLGPAQEAPPTEKHRRSSAKKGRVA